MLAMSGRGSVMRSCARAVRGIVRRPGECVLPGEAEPAP